MDENIRENIEKAITIIRNFPEMVNESLTRKTDEKGETLFELIFQDKLKKRIKEKRIGKIVFLGVGGSYAAADFAKNCVEGFLTIDSAVSPCCSSELPLNKETLTIPVSYSGNTFETLYGLKEAYKANAAIAVISSGGKILSICRKKEIPFVKVPSGLQPRFAFPYLVMSCINILRWLNLANVPRQTLAALPIKLREKTSWVKDRSKEISKEIGLNIPIIYVSHALRSLANVFKITINENAKTPCLTGLIPEICHNDILWWRNYLRKKEKFTVVLIKVNGKEPEATLANVTANMMSKWGIHYVQMEISEKRKLEEMFIHAFLALYLSIFMAKNKGVDPLDIGEINEFKANLLQRRTIKQFKIN